ncbi:unnamed protein product, partial [Owenia fusiformis]
LGTVYLQEKDTGPTHRRVSRPVIQLDNIHNRTTAKFIEATMSSNGDSDLDREPDENPPSLPCSSKTSNDYFNPNFRKRLNDLWHNDLFCDITLEVEGKQFNCHKVILSANSQYFQSMFSNGMSETSQNTIVLKDVSSKVMENILNHLYC